MKNMNYEQTYNLMGNVDIYVIDQILKGRYQDGKMLLDAGCGGGRNLKWFYQNNYQIYGVDADSEELSRRKMNTQTLHKILQLVN